MRLKMMRLMLHLKQKNRLIEKIIIIYSSSPDDKLSFIDELKILIPLEFLIRGDYGKSNHGSVTCCLGKQ